MIKAEQDTEQDIVVVEQEGDRDQYEHEIIAILVNARSAFTLEDLAEMLCTADEYYTTDMQQPAN